MPDVDLAVILDDGDYLKREGDQLVGRLGLVAAEYYDVALTVSGATSGAGLFFNGTIAVPTAPVKRVVTITFGSYLNLGGQHDITIVAPGAVNLKRFRTPPVATNYTLTFSCSHVLLAGASGNQYAVKISSIAGTATAATAGGIDMNFLTITTVPTSK